MLRILCGIILGAATASIVLAQGSPAPDANPVADSDNSSDVTLLPHSNTDGYWISAQANVVFQWHPSFPAKYTGTNSMTPGAQSATTHVVTLYTGWEAVSYTHLTLPTKRIV